MSQEARLRGRTPSWLQALVFPALALLVLVAGWLGLGRPAPEAYADWLPSDGSVAWARVPVSPGVERYLSVQQGQLTSRELDRVAPLKAISASTRRPVWRVEFNDFSTVDAPVEEGSGGLGFSITFAIDAGLELLTIETPTFLHQFDPGIPVLNDDLLAGRDATVMTEVRGSAAGERLVRVEVRDSTLLPGCSVSLVTIPWADAERVVTLAWCRGRGLVGYGEGDRGENAMILPAPRPEPLLRSAVGVPGWPNGQVRSKVETEEVHRWLGSRESFAPTTIKLGAVLPNGLVLHAGDATVLGLRHGTDPEWATTRVWLEHRWRIVLDKEATALAGGPQGGAVTDSGGHLIVFQPEGGILWRHQLDDVASAVALDGSVVVARTLDGRVSAFDFASGARLWSTLIDAKTTGQKLASRDGIVAILTRDSLTVLDGQTGRQLFEWSGIAPEATAVVEGRVVVVERALGVAAVDLDGRIAWQRNPGVVANGQLIVSDDRIVVVTASAATAFDLDGARVWQQPGQWNHGLAAAGGHVVLVGAGGSRLVGPDGVARGNWPGSTMVGALVVTPFGVYGQGVWQ